MAIISGGTDVPFNMNHFFFVDLFRAPATDQSSIGENLNEGADGIFHVTGHHLTFDASGQIATGTVTGISLTNADGDLVFDYSGISLDGAQLHSTLANLDVTAINDALTGGNDTLTGTPFADVLDGSVGHDFLVGGPGADTLIGGDGNDHLYGQSNLGGPDGDDMITGGAGSDYLQGNAGNDTLDGGFGSDRINGGAGNDYVVGGYGYGNDTVNGNMGDDFIAGGFGNSILRGGQGNDQLSGGMGHDTLMGDMGDDTISGGIGDTIMTGGPGADLFRVGRAWETLPTGSDYQIVTDFTPGEDHLSVALSIFRSPPPAVLHLLAPATDFASAGTEAQSLYLDLFKAHDLNNDVAAVQVGSDTYLFWAEYYYPVDSTVELQNVNASAIQLSDFVPMS